ncbi:MAG: transcriptional regulator protein [Candidatus Methanoperedens sp.]|nr:transcriptional regulator protein [Candidatus Methanoperedens sp.]MCZ7371713.1 transcriptional regulator protein [Candidatus Methanoperedens sp.]
MEKRNIKQLDDKHEEIADALIAIGMSRNIARTLSYLQNVDNATSVDLERVARLYQPEVSIAIKQLKEREWINEREEKKVGKGRPYKIYSLKIGFNDIISQLENQQREAVNGTLEKIEKLKELRKDQR